jgi:hypothetical protein
MGEKLYVISKVNLPGLGFDIELNDGSAASKRPLHIHLQNDRFRLDMPDHEYIQMAIAVREAGKKIRKMKGIEKTDHERDCRAD